MLPLSGRSSEQACAGRLMLFYNVFDFMAGIQARCVRGTGLDHILRWGATWGTWDGTFILNQMLTSQLSFNHVSSNKNN